jgi:hypothetical protein
MKPGTLRVMKHRFLDKPDENAKWAKAIGGKTFEDGVYALITFQNRAATPYMVMTREQFLTDGDIAIQMDDALDLVVRDILRRRIRNGKVQSEDQLQHEYDAIENELTRLAWRVKLDEKWYTADELPGLLASLSSPARLSL